MQWTWEQLEALGFSIEFDNYGQIVLYTDLMDDGKGNLVQFVEPEEGATDGD